MLIINKLTEPGGIRRIEIRHDIVRIVLRDGTERMYPIARERETVAVRQPDTLYGELSG